MPAHRTATCTRSRAAGWPSELASVPASPCVLGVLGATDRRQASQALTPGGFVLLPANMRHFAWTAVPTVVQINLQGPFDIFYVNPADNPQSTVTKR